MIASDTQEALDATVAEIDDLISEYGHPTYSETGHTLTGKQRGHENFGFKDGISQPTITGYGPASSAAGPAATALGELVLGFPDQNGATATVDADFAAGSYLVFRRLTQDVEAFHAQATAAAAQVNPPLTGEQFEAKMVGRWPSGAPLELNPTGDPGPAGVTNDFTFQAADDDGHITPQWSHIRKVNPRDETQPLPPEDPQRHRMIRRGIPFKTDAHAHGATPEHGLHFLTVVADLARQFEFVQSRWLDDPNFPNGGTPSTPGTGYAPPVSGIPAAGPDPIGAQYPDGAPVAYVPAQGTPPTSVALIHQLVRMTGGEYYFLPSIPALADLASPLATTTVPS